jgi:DNA-binding GntR family transcriptional regulator
MMRNIAVDRSAAGSRRPRRAETDESRHEAIYRAVFDAIIEHKLPPGAKLSEDQLSEVFGVSRTIIRAVLQRLTFEGLVTTLRNRGASVAKPTVEEAQQVFQARRFVEVMMVRDLAVRLGREAKRRLSQHVASERAAHAARDGQSSIRLSGEFHLLLAEIHGNEVLARFMRELISRSSLIIAVYSTRVAASCSADAHAALVTALGRGDADAAAALITEHLEEVEHSVDLRPREPAPVDLRRVFGA